MTSENQSQHIGRARRLITVTGPDRPGLIAAISRALADSGADLEDVSMTRLSGNFAMMVLARGGDQVQLTSHVKEAGARLGLHVHVEQAVEHTDEAEPDCYVAASGPNRIGIVAAISEVLSRHRANVTEMTTRLLERTQVPVYLVRIEAATDPRDTGLEQDLKQAAEALGVEVRLERIERIDL